MVYLGGVPPPSCLGFVRNPNLVLPPYITTEVHVYRDESGNLITHRRPRPLSVIAGAEFILQCDQDRLARYVWFRMLYLYLCVGERKRVNLRFMLFNGCSSNVVVIIISLCSLLSTSFKSYMLTRLMFVFVY